MNDVKILLSNLQSEKYSYLNDIIDELKTKGAKFLTINDAQQVFFCKNMINKWINQDFNYCYVYSRDMFLLKLNIKGDL